ncbi:hypothetical protein PENSPDRAFT_600428 [Peniophora sp. CONT]|nr:hypothetical protein PENSPDRAFT_600428 [Peniophora sp. CONT]
MPVATIDDGLQFFYEDSGAGQGSYLTIVFVHGSAFTAGIFNQMMPFAAEHNVRLVALNRRDYPETTPYSSEELAALSSTDNVVRERVLRETGLQFGAFLAWFIGTHSTPPIKESLNGQHEGGIAFVAWSLGHTSAAPLIARPDLLPEDQRSLLDTHLRAYCTLDAPGASFGLPPPTTYHPLTEDEVPVPDRLSRFEQWVSAYYTHSPEAMSTHDVTLLDLSPMAYPTPEDNADRAPTLFAMDPEAKAAISWPAPLATSELYLFTMPSEIVFEHTRRAILDESTAKTLPRCKFVLIWSGRGSWASVAGAWGVERLRNDYDKQGGTARPFEVIELPWANHFPHWDDPEQTVKFLASVC